MPTEERESSLDWEDDPGTLSIHSKARSSSARVSRVSFASGTALPPEARLAVSVPAFALDKGRQCVFYCVQVSFGGRLLQLKRRYSDFHKVRREPAHPFTVAVTVTVTVTAASAAAAITPTPSPNCLPIAPSQLRKMMVAEYLDKNFVTIVDAMPPMPGEDRVSLSRYLPPSIPPLISISPSFV